MFMCSYSYSPQHILISVLTTDQIGEVSHAFGKKHANFIEVIFVELKYRMAAARIVYMYCREFIL
jgi:hypothetical protein